MDIKELKKEYATQDNRSTAYPIYVTVQELFCVGVIADGYSVNCPCGDGKTITKYRLEDGDCDAPEFDSEEELIKYYKENDNERRVRYIDIQEYQLGYIWIDVEFYTVNFREPKTSRPALCSLLLHSYLSESAGFIQPARIAW